MVFIPFILLPWHTMCGQCLWMFSICLDQCTRSPMHWRMLLQYAWCIWVSEVTFIRSAIFSTFKKGKKKMPKIEEKCMKLLELLGRDDFVALMLYVFYGSVDLCWIKYKWVFPGIFMDVFHELHKGSHRFKGSFNWSVFGLQWLLFCVGECHCETYLSPRVCTDWSCWNEMTHTLNLLCCYVVWHRRWNGEGRHPKPQE